MLFGGGREDKFHAWLHTELLKHLVLWRPVASTCLGSCAPKVASKRGINNEIFFGGLKQCHRFFLRGFWPVLGSLQQFSESVAHAISISYQSGYETGCMVGQSIFAS